MKRLMQVIIVLAFLAIGLGFYRGWFTLSSPNSEIGNNKLNVNLETDPDRMKADVEKVKEKTTDFTGKVTKGAKDLGEKSKEQVKTN